jgi:hypothetical protein
MSDFEAVLRRGFAEIDEPSDEGFSHAVAGRVAGRVRMAKLGAAGRSLAVGVACIALAFGGLELFRAFGPQVLATAGLELARAHGALTQAEGVQPATLLASMGGALTQVLLAGAAAAGGLAAFRASQE